MNIPGVIHLGSRYLARHRTKAVLLISAITLSLFLPLGISLVVRQAEEQLRARANSTPLVLGAKGSPLELVFNGLYFSMPDLTPFPLGEAEQLLGDEQKKAKTVIPIYSRFEAKKHPIVGTSLEYFRFRGLEVAEGRMMTRLGDCVIGSGVAKKLGLGPDERLLSKSEQMIGLTGVRPLNMRITGVLTPTSGPDDHAVFVDLKTTWIIEGIAHGHNEATPETTLEEQEGNTALNAAVIPYNEITDENVDSFHFHGETSEFPISAAIVIPRDRKKAETMLLGEYISDTSLFQMIRPGDVMTELFATVFRIRDLVVVALVAVGLASALIAGLVFLLSNRLRAREFESLANIGADPATTRALLFFEAGFVILSSVVLAGILLATLNLIIPKLLPVLMA
ncbi:MAG: putative ABC transport system permease protein [Verrucomicrobiales bacterium]